MRNDIPACARFFMAEDNPGDVILMKEAIAEIGLWAEVEVEIDGALAIARLTDPSHRVPDIIILNYNLPKMQGHEVLAAIKRTEQLREVPVVMLTTSTAQADRLLCESADAYFIKSGDWEELLLIVGHLRDLIHATPSRSTNDSLLADDGFWDQKPQGQLPPTPVETP